MSDGISDGLSGFPLPPQTAVIAIPREQVPGKWYVYWETDVAYGFRGSDMTEEQANEMARQLLAGEVKL